MRVDRTTACQVIAVCDLESPSVRPVAASSNRIAVVSGHYPGSSFPSSDNHRLYCDRHGYTYVWCSWPTRATNPYFNKFEFIRHYLDLFDLIFWIDDDAFFVDFDQPLDAILPSAECFLSICASPDYKSISTVVSSGQFALRCNDVGRAFVDEVLATDLDLVEAWWPDDAGFFTRGDQDAMVYLLRTREAYRTGVEIHHYSLFNSRLDDILGKTPADGRVFLLHFTGPPERKRRDWSRAQAALDRGPALIPRGSEAGWSLRPEPTLRWRARRVASLAKRRSRRVLELVRRTRRSASRGATS